MVNDEAPVQLAGIRVAFDDERAVADAGIMVCATPAERLRIERLVAVIGEVLGHRLVAPSTLGTFLRSFTFGHVRQLDRVLGETLRRAWAAGAGPREGRLVVDVDSFVGEIFGRKKQVPRSATPASAATTRSWPSAPTRARYCTSGSGRARPTPRAGCSVSATSSSPVCSAPARSGRSCCAPTRGFWCNDTSERLERVALAVLHRRAPATPCPRGDRADRRDRVDDPARRPAHEHRPDRRDHARRPPARRPPRPHRGSPGRAAGVLGAVSLPHQLRTVVGAEHRQHAVVELAIRDLKDQSARALPLRALLRQRRVDGHRRARPQPAALDERARPPPPDPPRRPHPAPATPPLPGRLTRTAGAGRCTSPPAGPGRPRPSSAHPASARCLRRADRILERSETRAAEGGQLIMPAHVPNRLQREHHARRKTPPAPAASSDRIDAGHAGRRPPALCRTPRHRWIEAWRWLGFPGDESPVTTMPAGAAPIGARVGDVGSSVSLPRLTAKPLTASAVGSDDPRVVPCDGAVRRPWGTRGGHGDLGERLPDRSRVDRRAGACPTTGDARSTSAVSPARRACASPD
jgi:hypothetical protein